MTEVPVLDLHRRLRHVATGISASLAVVYIWMFFAVRTAETGARENTFGAYLQLAVVYAAGALLLLLLDQRWVWAVGAGLQVVVITLFLVFGVAILDYDLVADLPLRLWITLTAVGQLALLGLLGYLAATGSWQAPTAGRPGSTATAGRD
jgi:hypothetical protein